MTTKICENPECGREFEPSNHASFQRYCKTFGDRCQKRHYAATHKEQQDAHRKKYAAKVNARMEAEKLARLGGMRICALKGCDAMFTPHPNALATHIYHSEECRKAAKIKGDAERLTRDPNKVPWGEYGGHDVSERLLSMEASTIGFGTLGI